MTSIFNDPYDIYSAIVLRKFRTLSGHFEAHFFLQMKRTALCVTTIGAMIHGKKGDVGVAGREQARISLSIC